MNCKVYKEQIIEDYNSISPEAKIHIENCLKCKKLYYEYSRFEKIMSGVKNSLEQNSNTHIKPEYVINLAFLEKAMQNNLAYLKRMYIYATIILVIFIYAFLFNTLQYVDGKVENKNVETSKLAINTDYFDYDEKELQELDKLTNFDDEFIDEMIVDLDNSEL